MTIDNLIKAIISFFCLNHYYIEICYVFHCKGYASAQAESEITKF